MKTEILAVAAFAAFLVQSAVGQGAQAQTGTQDSAYQICQRAGIPVGTPAMTDCIHRLGADARAVDRSGSRSPGGPQDGVVDQQAELPPASGPDVGNDARSRSGPAELAPTEERPAAPKASPPEDMDNRRQR